MLFTVAIFILFKISYNMKKNHIFIYVNAICNHINTDCIIRYNGSEVPLTIVEGEINLFTNSIGIYHDFGFIEQSLNDCVVKICSLLEQILSINNVNICNDAYQIDYGCSNYINYAKIILEYESPLQPTTDQ